MNEIQINAQFACVAEQRNSALNTAVNQAGDIAVLKAKIAELEKQLEAATALVSEFATVEENHA